MQKEKTSKEKYLEMRERGYSNKGIAEFYKVKESTVDRAIGKNKKESTGNMNTDTMDFSMILRKQARKPQSTRV